MIITAKEANDITVAVVDAKRKLKQLREINEKKIKETAEKGGNECPLSGLYGPLQLDSNCITDQLMIKELREASYKFRPIGKDCDSLWVEW